MNNLKFKPCMSRGTAFPARLHVRTAKLQIAHSDQSLHYPPEDAWYPWLSTSCSAKTQIRPICVFAGRIRDPVGNTALIISKHCGTVCFSLS